MTKLNRATLVINILLGFIVTSLTIISIANQSDLSGFFTQSPITRDITCILLPLLAFALLILSFIEIFKRSNHTFKLGSPAFNKFFSKWYSKQGRLSIVCKDLEWIGHDDIYYALEKKAHEGLLDIYIEADCKYAYRLQTSGARVHKIKNSIAQTHSFSILESFLKYSIIVRDKAKDSKENIAFQERHDTYTSTLIQDLINKL